MVSESELKPPMPMPLNSSSNMSSSSLINQSTATKEKLRDDDNDSNSVQPLDPLRKKWMVTASNCDYNELVQLLKLDPTLAGSKVS